METDTALTVPEPINTTIVALTPAEMPAAQSALLEWCDKKIEAIERELAQWVALEDEAIAGGFRATSYAANASRTKKRIVYYQKIKAAIDAGYLIVPNMPIQAFAVRVNRERPHRQEADYSWKRFTTPPENLPAGTGRYVDDELAAPRTRKTTKQQDGKMVEKTIYFADEYDANIDFPMRGVHPTVLGATGRAMALRLFDELGLVQNSGGRDPIVVGRLLDPRGNGRLCTFFVAWWLDTSTL